MGVQRLSLAPVHPPRCSRLRRARRRRCRGRRLCLLLALRRAAQAAAERHFEWQPRGGLFALQAGSCRGRLLLRIEAQQRPALRSRPCPWAIAAAQQHSSTAAQQHSSTACCPHSAVPLFMQRRCTWATAVPPPRQTLCVHFHCIGLRSPLLNKSMFCLLQLAHIARPPRLALLILREAGNVNFQRLAMR